MPDADDATEGGWLADRLRLPDPWRLLDAARLGAAAIDPVTLTVVDANDEGVRLLGIAGSARCAPGDGRPRPSLAAIAPELAAAVRDSESDGAAPVASISIETTLAGAGGRTRHVRATIAPADAGNDGAVLALLEDLGPRDALVAAASAAEARFAALFDAEHLVVLLVDPDGRIVDANSAASRFYGYSHGELVGLRMSAINIAPQDRIDAEIRKAYTHDQQSFAFQHRLASGEIRDVMVTTGPIVLDGRQLLCSVVEDTTARCEAERRADRMQRLWTAMAEIDHLIARVQDPETLFREACRIAIDVAGFRMAWVGRVDESTPERWIEVIDMAGAYGEGLDDIRVAASEDVPEGRGAMGRAIRERRPVVIDDFFAEKDLEPWWERARAEQYASVAALPLFIPGRAPLVAAVYSPVPGAFGPAELRILERIVDDVGFRLEVLDGEAARRAAEEALRVSEERYRSLVEQSPDGIFVVDGEGRFTDASEAACRILGYPLDVLRTRSLRDLAPEPWGSQMVLGIGRLDPNEPHEQHVPYRRPDGVEVAAEIRIHRLADGRVQGVIRDVTATRAAEDERDRLATAVEQVAESVAIVDLEGVVTYVNPVFRALSGYESEEIVGTSILRIRSGLLDPKFYAGLDDAPKAGRTWSGRIVNRRKDGSTYEIDLVSSPIRDRTGRLVGSVQVGRDTSKERALEAQLAEAQRMEAVGRLAGGVAHDFNNLLTAISGYAELALGELHEPDSAREDIAEILRAAGRASTLTRQLLAFSRRQLLQPRLVDVGGVIRGIAPMLRRLIGEDVRLDVLCDPGAGCVLADEGHLEQVVMNLAVNARDAMPQGGVLRLETRRVELDDERLAGQPDLAPGSFVELRVVDTGVGMAPDVVEHVFEPFFTTKERGKGTGLGLSMVFGIVRQSNGFITVESVPGAGSTFSVFLPRAAGEAERHGDPLSSPASGSGTETILVVEDEALVRTYARRVLERNGFRVLEANGGEQALEIAAREGDSIDLLFTDVVMPSMGGRELAARLTRARPTLRVLYASGYTEDAFAGRSGFADVAYLGKPYAADELLARVHEVLSAPRRH